jgi:hypothetical protein
MTVVSKRQRHAKSIKAHDSFVRTFFDAVSDVRHFRVDPTRVVSEIDT